jgi:alpha-L-fucosidase
MGELPLFADRSLPRWFDDAKFGIFIHWGPYAVPCFAPVDKDMGELFASGKWEEVFRWSPYTEWYPNTMSLEGSATAAHHHATYGDRDYASFIDEFESRCVGVDVAQWAQLFADAGARYVVPVTKHHDGYAMWDRDGTGGVDYVTSLCREVRARGLRFGTYYSGGLDWRFSPPPIRNLAEMIAAIPTGADYAELVVADVADLVSRYQPDVLWNDIGWPPVLDPNDTFVSYYTAVPHGVVNDRFDFIAAAQGRLHADFITPEYSSTPRDPTRKFEVCRGIGRSFGYNRMESDATLATVDELVWMLVDIVARGGNLLLNVGPTADGQIPLAQASRLLAIGWWLRVNGDAIYGTSAGGVGVTGDGREVRYTRRDETTYAMVRGTVDGRVELPNAPVTGVQEVRLAGSPRVLPFSTVHDVLRVELPDHLPASPVTTLVLVSV